ncbi:MAG TPA: sulfotransferase [Vicinamibacterales bacterium]|jgi:hypothetical protein
MGAPLPLSTWFGRAIYAYRVGRARPIAMSDGPSGALFRSLAQAHIQTRLSHAHYREYTAIRDWSRQAVASARGDGLQAAERLFARAETHLADASLPDEPRLLSESWIEQARAYLAARLRDWPGARSHLSAAMAADAALEDQFGYDVFHIGRVHTVHLWLRTEAQAGDRAAAIDLAQEIIDYVAGSRPALSIGQGWSAERAAAVPEALRVAMVARVASEVGAVLADADQDEARALLGRIPGWQRFRSHPVLGEFYDWGVTKTACVSGDTAGFLERAEPILAQGRCETTLWYAVALDVYRALAALRPEAAALFQSELRADIESWRAVPIDVQTPALSSLLARETSQAAPRAFRHTLPARRFHVCTVGLPRTGTTSLYTLFEQFRTGNEFMERETIGHCVDRTRGDLTTSQLEMFLRRRDVEGGLEMDSASFHHLVLDLLIAHRPETKFIFTVRAPYEWANSYLKMLLGWHQRFTAAGAEVPEWMAGYGTMLFGEFSWAWVASTSSIQRSAHHLADIFVRHWAEANRRVLNLLPRDRALIVRTEELSAQRAAIAAFMGLPVDRLTGPIHSNAGADRRDLLADVGRAWVEERARHYGADVLRAAGLMPGTVPA